MLKNLCVFGTTLAVIGIFSIHLVAEGKKTITTTTTTTTQAEPPVLNEMNVKIAKGLKSKKWSNESKNLIAKVWSEYKAAFIRNKPKMDYSGPRSLRPDIKKCDEYLGRYSRKKGDARVWMEVFKDAEGRFIVKLDRHEIPSVAYNRGILVTTGDVVYSPLPRLGPKPHVTLEMFVLSRIKGQYYVTGTRSTQPGLKLYLIKSK